MAAFLSIKADVRDAVRYLTDAQKKQVPFATAKALNALAFEAQVAERVNTKRRLSHPRPFTQRGTLVTKATKSNPTATVYLRPEVAAYLAPFEFGGPHVLPGGALLNPKNVKLDSYGQMKRGLPAQLLGQPGVFAGTITFKKSGQTVTGIWRRPPPGAKGAGKASGSTTGLDLLIRLGDALPVTKHLEFFKTAKAVIAARGAVVFGDALAKALLTARK